ncbi:hypothetical protein [Rosenbergiella nectarea]|uniref:hypothetical protein n=1 Tax=Rosenbergiella nectarea TaxID=988801 RepID=UPI001F4DC3B5|nr:hypothetical protein [Rosenbergiella nectarea]
MYKLRGVISIRNLKRIIVLIILLCSPCTYSISIGELTFSLAPEKKFLSKLIINNNASTRLYRVSISRIVSPLSKEINTQPVEGEILFSPRQFTLQSGESEYFKFYYNGPKDERERYYRISFREIPIINHVQRNMKGDKLNMDPVIVLDAIFIVRPRKVNFKWIYDRDKGTLGNIGNTWFKVLIKPGCNTTEEEGETWYLLPGESINNKKMRLPGDNFIVYNDQFIKIDGGCN